MQTTNQTQFVLNGETVMTQATPTTSLLEWLRGNGFTGSKEGCAEGDCGACTLVVARLASKSEQQQGMPVVVCQAINSCIALLPTFHRKLVYSVEYLISQNGTLHPVQQALVDCHASQCGFCTPGFVMSLWALYITCERYPGEQAIRNAISGNLCRCTGYKPIIQAGKQMFNYPRIILNFEHIETKLRQLATLAPLEMIEEDNSYYAPGRLKQLIELKAEHPDATLMAGCTDLGLWLNKQLLNLPKLVNTTEVAELTEISQTNESIIIGAAVSLSSAFAVLQRHYPELEECVERFAALPTRNAGTLGGNIANGSPIGDSMPILIALSSSIRLESSRGSRTIKLEDSYLDYRKKSWEKDEVLVSIKVPMPTPNMLFGVWKVSKRFDSDISAVLGAFGLWINDENTISQVRIAYGGMAAIPKRASKVEAAMLGQKLNGNWLAPAQAAIKQDFSPIDDMRATGSYRLEVAQNLLERLLLLARGSEIGSLSLYQQTASNV